MNGSRAIPFGWSRGNPVLWLLFLCLAAIHLYDAWTQHQKLRPFSRLLTPAQEVLEKPFEVAPIFEAIGANKRTRFIVVHGDADTWGSAGRVSATILHHDLRLVAHDQIATLLSFTPNRSTERIARLWGSFSKLSASAQSGILDLPCAVEVANNALDHEGEIYVLSAKNLRVVSHPSATRKAESRDLIAWHISLGDSEPSSGLCR